MLRAAPVLALCLVALPCRGGPPDPETFLPPALPWDGASRSLMAAPDHPWITPAEASGLTRSPSYDETMAWLRRLVDASPRLRLVSLGQSHEGRDIWMVIASADGAFEPGAVARSGKPVLLAHAGIHAGEIDGKDAGLMLLRDLVLDGTKAALLENAHLLFVPILNVDGHERASRYGRMNQRGPEVMGWRTNARNLNLNRDYAKLDTPELRALVGAINAWTPDLYLDLHVTDGIDYQYDITYGYNAGHGWSPSIAAWLDETLRPAVDAELDAMGHVPGPLVFGVDSRDPSRGVVRWMATPRYSNGYGDARHLPTVILENHSLKPYDRRVLGTYVFLEACLRVLGEQGTALRKAASLDRARRPTALPVGWRAEPARARPGPFLGVSWEHETSGISGEVRVRWTGEPVTLTVPWIPATRPVAEVDRPAAYWLPPTHPEIVERLLIHGVRMERIDEPQDVAVEMYRIDEPELADEPFEGRVRVSGTPRPERRTQRYPVGSVRVTTDQPLGDLVVLLLEPASPDSFFQWGFFHEILQRTEYFEAYVMEPFAEQMMAEDPALAEAFAKRLAEDEELAGSGRARLEWFYERSPWYDARHRLYPVGREMPRRSADRRTFSAGAPSRASTPR